MENCGHTNHGELVYNTLRKEKWDFRNLFVRWIKLSESFQEKYHFKDLENRNDNYEKGAALTLNEITSILQVLISIEKNYLRLYTGEDSAISQKFNRQTTIKSWFD